MREQGAYQFFDKSLGLSNTEHRVLNLEFRLASVHDDSHPVAFADVIREIGLPKIHSYYHST